MKESVFKPSKSEKRGLKLLNPNMKNILSVGISTGALQKLIWQKFVLQQTL